MFGPLLQRRSQKKKQTQYVCPLSVLGSNVTSGKLVNHTKMPLEVFVERIKHFPAAILCDL